MDINNRMIGKELEYKGVGYSISALEAINTDDGSQMYLTLKKIKGKDGFSTLIPTKSFDRGLASTKDAELMDYVALCNREYDEAFADIEAKRAEAAKSKAEADAKALKEEQEAHERYINGLREQGSLDGRVDARTKNPSKYKLYTSADYKSMLKASRVDKAYRDAYTVAYEDAKADMKRERLINSRAMQLTLDEYPGDLDELIGWMRSHILRVDVVAPSDKIANEQIAVDAINERDGTNYQVKLKAGQFIGYEAWFRDPKSAPKDFLEWRVSKHDYRTSDLSARVLEHPLNIKTGKLTSNSIVKELVYNPKYGFHVGKAD